MKIPKPNLNYRRFDIEYASEKIGMTSLQVLKNSMCLAVFKKEFKNFLLTS